MRFAVVGDAMTKTETKSIEDLLPDPNNVNRHTQRGHGLVENSIRRRGVGRGILAAGKNTEKPVIMAGNLTHEKARDAGISEVVFVHTTGNQLVVNVRDDLDPTSPEAIALGIEDNESGKLSYNPDIDLLAAMSAGDNGVLSKLKEDDKIFGDMLAGMGVKDSEPVDAEPQIDRAAELAEKWHTASGQLWKLGEHRLLIGDCTVRENVERLMGGERARMMLSDPPYNVNYEYSQTEDNKSQSEYIEFCNNYFKIGESFSDMQVITPGKANERIYPYKEYMTWYKGFGLSRGSFYKAMVTEPILLLGEKPKNKFYATDHFDFMTDRTEGLRELHTCPKPIKLFEAIIEPMTDEHDLIYEAFCGSGTTLLAAHNLNRRCYAMEISPNYGGVILERFYTATGITPELVE